MGKTILLMRHAEAGDGTAGLRDFDRSLIEEGCWMARQTAECLKTPGLSVDRILASSSKRTQQTAEIVASEMKDADGRPEIPVVLIDSLYNAIAEAIAASIRQEAQSEDSAILVVGHNPGIAALMSHWAEQSLSVPPATLTMFQFEAAHWEDIRFYSPKKPRYLCLIQEGRIAWKASSFHSSDSAQD
jgi:phosphohistidine phosphatase